MNATGYTILAYALASALLWGYAIKLCWTGRALCRREEMAKGQTPAEKA